MEAPAPAEVPAPSGAPLAELRCAVVADEATSRAAIETLLQSLGAQLVAPDAAALIVYDVPVREPAAWLRRLPERRTPGVALIAPGTPRALELKRLSVTAVVRKPASSSLVEALVRAYRPSTVVGCPCPARLRANAKGTPEVPPPRYAALVAEDNPVNAKVLVRLLERQGATCEVVDNGALAVRRAGQAPFDIIFMDINMPEMDGLEATRELRAAGHHEPIVAITASSSYDEEDECGRAGVTAFLPKPVNPRRLAEVVRELVATELHSRPEGCLLGHCPFGPLEETAPDGALHPAA